MQVKLKNTVMSSVFTPEIWYLALLESFNLLFIQTHDNFDYCIKNLY